ncbi:hypothetical protein H3C66_02215 [Patescibacteria group bacterium]|nr:hypothetical protein [Patescibacteria group bacterium]
MQIKTRRSPVPKKATRRGGMSPVMLFYGAMVVLGLVIAAVIVTFGKNLGWFGTKEASVSGEIVYTALKPDPSDKGTVRLFYRDQGSTQEFVDAGFDIPLVPNQAWQWSTAQSGKNYELQARLVIDGNVVKRSDIESITAPATDVDLALKVNWRDLPADVVASSDLAINGTVSINGYIPPGSRLQILQADNTVASADQPLAVGDSVEESESTVQSISNPTSSNVWSWASAVPLKTYTFRAVLMDSSGNQIGESDQLVNIEAADQQVAMIINSTAQPTQSQAQPSPSTTAFAALAASPQPSPTTAPATPSPAASTVAQAQPSPAPAPTAKIKGTVYLNGPMNQGTSLLMLWKNPSQANYSVVNRYQNPNQAGTSWEFDSAIPGQQYEIQAALQVNGQNTSTAPQPLTVTAPANNVNFTLNTNFLVPAPGSQPSLQVCINNDDAVIILPQIQNAAQLWVQVGTSQGDSSLANTKIQVGPNSGDQKIQVAVPRGQQTYVRYSYAECANCTNSNNFSPWSQSTGFTCQ